MGRFIAVEPEQAGVRIRTSSPLLVARGTHLATLRQAIARLPAVVLVEGEAGVGKTRLVAELLDDDLGPTLPLVGACRQLGEPFSYGAVLDALRGAERRLAKGPALNPVTGMLAPLLPEIAEFLPAPPQAIGDPRAERHRLFRAVRELLRSIGPAILVVEDLHWADDGTRHLLRFLATDPPDGLAIVITYRREDLPGGSPLGAEFRPSSCGVFAVVELSPLDIDGVRAMTEAIVDRGEVSAGFAERLHERTAGIPFAVEETLHALRDPAGAVQATDARARRLLDAVEVPALLRDGMADRLSALPAVAVRLVHAAAVLGVPAPADLLGRVGGVPTTRLHTALAHALDGHVLYEVDGGYGFRHPLARQSVYDSIVGPKRVHLHDRAVAALESVHPRPLAQLAGHSERAGRTLSWLAYGEAAADRAIAAGDAATATTLLQRLLAAAALPASQVNRMSIALGRIAHTGLDQHDPTETLARVLADPRLSTSARGEVRHYRALLLIRQIGRIREAREEFELAIGELTERPDLVAQATAVLSMPYFGTVPPAELSRWRGRAASYRTTATGELRISLLANELGGRMHLGERVRLGDLPDTVETVGERRHLARLRCNVADACVWLGHLDLGARFLHDGLRLAEANGAPFLVSTGRTTEARLDWLTGRWVGLAGRTRALVEEYRDLTSMTSELELVLGWVAAAQGDWKGAGEHFARTGARTPEDAITPVAVAGGAGAAACLLARKADDEAVDAVERALDVVRGKDAWTWAADLAPVAVDVCVTTDRVDDATRVVDELAAGIAGRDAPIATAALARCRGTLARQRGNHDEAVDRFREAATRYAELRAPYFAALAAEQAAACLASSNSAEAIGLLSGLVDAFDELGATVDAARCRRALRGLGGVKPLRRGRRCYGNDLSPREVEVARMLAAGLTNREIAERLFLSRRTIEQHVARLFRKLGINSRAQLRPDHLN